MENDYMKEFPQLTEKTDIVRFSLQLFESKTSMIMFELEKIKDLFKLILAKSKFDEIADQQKSESIDKLQIKSKIRIDNNLLLNHLTNNSKNFVKSPNMNKSSLANRHLMNSKSKKISEVTNFNISIDKERIMSSKINFKDDENNQISNISDKNNSFSIPSLNLRNLTTSNIKINNEDNIFSRNTQSNSKNISNLKTNSSNSNNKNNKLEKINNLHQRSISKNSDNNISIASSKQKFGMTQNKFQTHKQNSKEKTKNTPIQLIKGIKNGEKQILGNFFNKSKNNFQTPTNYSKQTIFLNRTKSKNNEANINNSSPNNKNSKNNTSIQSFYRKKTDKSISVSSEKENELSPKAKKPIKIYDQKQNKPINHLDHRKFSILDIQSAEKSNDLRKLIEKNNRDLKEREIKEEEKLEKNNENMYESIDNDSKSYISKSDEAVENEEKNQILSNLKNKISKSIFLTIKSDVTPIGIKIKLISLYQDIYRLYPLKKLIFDQKNYLENKIMKWKILINENLSQNDNNILEDEFSASITAINSLNFITKIEEEKIKKLKTNDQNICDLMKIIYLITGEKFEDIPNENLFENLYQKILPKLKISSISNIFYLLSENLFINHICKELSIPEENIYRIIEILKENKNLYDIKHIKTISVGFSFIIFILKEIVNYISLMTSKGILFHKIRVFQKKMMIDIAMKNNCIRVLQDYSHRNSKQIE